MKQSFLCFSREKALESLVTVPLDYDHDTQIAKFLSFVQSQPSTRCLDKKICDAFFMDVCDRLSPGKTYEVCLYTASKPIDPELCIEFLKAKKSLFIGAQGLSLMYMQGVIPKGTKVVSFGKNTLSDEYALSVYQYTGGSDNFFYVCWTGSYPLCKGDSILCISEQS